MLLTGGIHKKGGSGIMHKLNPTNINDQQPILLNGQGKFNHVYDPTLRLRGGGYGYTGSSVSGGVHSSAINRNCTGGEINNRGGNNTMYGGRKSKRSKKNYTHNQKGCKKVKKTRSNRQSKRRNNKSIKRRSRRSLKNRKNKK